MNKELYTYFIEIIDDLAKEIYARTYHESQYNWDKIIILLDDIIDEIKKMEQKYENDK